MTNTPEKKITYQKLFWLFMIGSLIGVVLEGLFCLFVGGKWETHVVSMWGPFCIIYGFGAAGLYIGSVKLEKKSTWVKFAAFAVIATIVEYLCGWLLKYVLNMQAWDYSKAFMNVEGIVCLKMTVAWGVLGVLFSKYALPHIEKVFSLTDTLWRKALCVALSVFMAVNLSLTAVCIVRWAERHIGIEPTTQFEMFIDGKYNDDLMSKRFCEWRFFEDDHRIFKK